MPPFHIGAEKGGLKSAFQRRALRAFGMREESFVSVLDLLGRDSSPIRLVSELSKSTFDHWTDRRSGLTIPIAHGAIRMFEIDEAIVDLTYGAVFLPTGELVAESTVWDPLRFLMNHPRLPAKGSRAPLGDGIIVPSSSYYHFLLEDLPRIAWTLKNFPNQRLISGANCRPFGLESLSLLKGEMYRTTEAYLSVRNYHFVTFGSVSGWPTSDTINFVRSLGLSRLGNRHQGQNLKLYVSRLADSRSPINEDDVMSLAMQHGFQCVDASRLTWEEQIGLFSGATCVMGVHGAGLANLIWMPRGSRVIEIMDPSYYNPCYQWLSHHLGHDHTTLVNQQIAPGLVDLEALAAQLA